MTAGPFISTSCLDEENIRGYKDHYVQSFTCHTYDFVADLIEENHHGNRTIGVEKDNYYFTAACLEHLVKGLPNARTRDAEGIINWIRCIKSPPGTHLYENGRTNP